MAARANVGSDSDTTFYTPPGSNDPAWQFGYLQKPSDANTVVCRLCKKVLKGGIFRFKQHLAHRRGNIAPCPKVDEETKKQMSAYLDELMKKKVQKAKEIDDIRREVDIMSDVGSGAIDKRPRLSESVGEDMGSHGPTRQMTIKDAFAKDHRERVVTYICDWAYMASIPFHALTIKSLWKLLEAVGQYGPGLKPPTRHEISGPYLKNAMKRVSDELNCHREMWKSTGCSIMIDAWTGIRGRSLMNFCVNCSLGTSFLKSMDASEDAHTAEYIFQSVDQCIKEVGVDYVVQVVADNASANVAAGRLLQTKYPHIWWTSCAAHSIDLALEEISKEPRIKSAITKARALTVFIYGHTKTLSLMRMFTKKRDIARPGQTRFATTCLTLESILEKKDKLRLMFSSDEWRALKWSRTRKGLEVSSIVLSPTFWNQIILAIKVFTPLVHFLRVVDADRKPSMGFVYGGLEQAKQEIISSFNGLESSYKPFVDAIVSKTKGRLDTSLHLTAYFLNPYFFYNDCSMFNTNVVVKNGFMNCMEKFYPDLDVQDIITRKELNAYKLAQGLFATWWSIHGTETPHLQAMAVKILSLTSSSSGCERNWSTFESIHTKKRNRLDAKRLNDLVYVRFNANLKERRQDQSRDPISSKDRTHMNEWIGGEQAEDDEVYPGSGLTWGAVAHASGAEDILQPRRSNRGGAFGSSSSAMPIPEEDEEFIFEEEIDDEDDEEEDDVPLDDDDD